MSNYISELHKIEADYRAASARTEKLREQRNAAVLSALARGATHAEICKATGLTKGRISQIKQQNGEGRS